MNFFTSSNLRWIVVSTAIVYFVNAIEDNDVAGDMFSLEKVFKDHHPDVENANFTLVEKLNAEMHEKMCHQVLTQITPPEEDINKHKYVVPEAATIRKSRIIRNAPLYFQMVGVEYVPVIVCTYEDMKLYLIQSDEKHVFLLHRDQDNIFTFKSGLHAIDI